MSKESKPKRVILHSLLRPTFPDRPTGAKDKNTLEKSMMEETLPDRIQTAKPEDSSSNSSGDSSTDGSKKE